MDHVGLRVRVEPAAAKASGLEGIVVADTGLSHVDGERGELIIAGSRVEQLALAEALSFEQVAARLLGLGRAQVCPDMRADLGGARVAAFARVPRLSSSLSLPDAMDSLIAATAQGCAGSDCTTLLGALPVFVAAGYRLRAGLPIIPPSAERSHAEDF